MTIDQTVITVAGGEFELRLDRLDVADGAVQVSIGHQKLDYRTDDVRVSYTVYVNSMAAASGSFSPPTSFAQDRETVDAVPGDTITVALTAGDESVSLSGVVPAPFDAANVRVASCSAPSEPIEPGAEAVLSARVVNDNNAAGTVKVAGRVGGETRLQDVAVGAGETVTVEFVFVLDAPGEYDSEVSIP